MAFIDYKILGSGKEKVLVMHNWFCDSSSYDPMLPYIDTEKFTYVFVDLRGYGRSTELVGVYSVQEASDDVIALVNSFHWGQFHLVGHSMSGMIAQKIALDHFSRVKSLVAITPVPACGMPQTPELMLFLEEAARFKDENAIECVHLSTSRRYSHYAVQKMVKDWRRCSTIQSRLGYLHMYSNTDFSESVKGLTTPMLVIFAEYDFEGYEAFLKATFLSWYPNAQMECCQGSGHFPMQETPIYLASRMEYFFSQF